MSITESQAFECLAASRAEVGRRFDTTIDEAWLPVLSRFAADLPERRPLVIGLTGGQGSGKTVLSTWLKEALGRLCTCEVLSLDDYYSSCDDRIRLRNHNPGNPFYQIYRGMPGTHHTAALYAHMVDMLSGRSVELPVFDKNLKEGHGDICSLTRTSSAKTDIIILEGWMVGLVNPGSETAGQTFSREPARSIISRLDAGGRYWPAVLDGLSVYTRIWDLVDRFLLIRPQHWEKIFDWRFEQEKYNRQVSQSSHALSYDEVHNFVEPFVPFTRLLFDLLPTDERTRVIELDDRRNPVEV